MKDWRTAIIASMVVMIVSLAAFGYLSKSLNDSIQQQASVNKEILAQFEYLKKQSTQIDSSTPTPASVTVTPASTTDTIASVFSAEDANHTDFAKINKLKADFESLFVTYQFLYQCGSVEAVDYHILNSILAHKISSLNAAGRIQYDILTAAKGTYEEIYSRSSCEDPSITDMQKKFRDYITEAQKIRFVIE
jgi:hypothetical protein